MKDKANKKTEGTVRLSDLIAPDYAPLYRDIRAGGHTHYWISGGRGSGKSSLISLCVWLDLLRNREHHAILFRKVGVTLRQSVFAQMLWAAGALGLLPFLKTTLTPLSMTYLPTGQEIFFAGVDDPAKLKSIRPPFGGFGAVWFEEADEFAGKEELDNLLQSVLRGDGRAAVFYSYNPPKRAGHWIYAAAEQSRPDQLHFSSCWTMLPKSWLGARFIAEAEQLRQSNPTRYDNEYLGKPCKDELTVFRNLTLRPISLHEKNSFAERLRGLDFGYGTDPLHYVSCGWEAAKRRLFVLSEFRGYRVSLYHTAEVIQQENPEGGRVTADSAEPRSIAELRALGIRAVGAKKGSGSLEYGMRFLCDTVQEIVIDPRICPETAKELQAYALTRGRDGQIIGGWPDKNNHAIDALRYALEEVWRGGITVLN